MILFLKNLLFTVLVPGTVAVYLPHLIGSRDPAAPGMTWSTMRVLSLIPLASGAAVYFWCVWDFATFGRGTPAPIDAPRRLVVRGLYHCVRNPMYLGVLVVILGWVIYFASAGLLFYAVAIAVLFHVFVVAYEEPTLRGAFGRDYESYCLRVNRWVPRLGRRGAAQRGNRHGVR